jgi:hypothetical protein
LVFKFVNNKKKWFDKKILLFSLFFEVPASLSASPPPAAGHRVDLLAGGVPDLHNLNEW